MIVLSGCVAPAALAQTAPAQAAPAAPAAQPAPQAPGGRPPAPTRDPKTPGYVTATDATELPDGAVPPIDTTGNFILGPTHPPAPEMIDMTACRTASCTR